MNRIHLRPDSLWYKAIYLIVSITIFVVIEVSLGLWFKSNIMTSHFGAMIELERRSQNPMISIWIAAELARELAVPSEGPVFLRTNNWTKRLEQLSHLESTSGKLANFAILEKFNVAIKQLRILNDNNADVDEFRVYASDLIKIINEHTKYLHQKVSTLSENRQNLFVNFRNTTNLYMVILLGIGIIGVLIVVISGGIFLTRLVRSLEQLELRAKRITLGDYGSKMITYRKDEVGNLVGSINNMAKALKKQEKEAEEFHHRLSSQEKMFTLGSFAAGIAHEIGNPIQAIMALISQIGESLGEDPSEKNVDENLKRLDIVVQQVERLSKSIRTIQEFTYSGSPDRELVDINTNIETATNLLRFDPRFKKLTIEFKLDTLIPPVMAVSDHVIQVVLNIVINACDAVSPKNGKVTISTKYETNMVSIAISDNGHGMTKSNKLRAMEPFFTTKPRGKGTGLGLSVCKDIIEELDGHIIIESEQDVGTTVIVELPVGSTPDKLPEGIIL